MRIVSVIKSWSLSISVIFVILAWYLLMQFVFISVEVRNVSLFWYSYFFAIAIWAIIAKKLSDHEKDLIAFLKEKYPKSRPFEYLFFTFLFISTGCLTLLVTFINDVAQLLLNNLFYTFSLVFFYAGSIVLGWFHYMKRVEG